MRYDWKKKESFNKFRSNAIYVWYHASDQIEVVGIGLRCTLIFYCLKILMLTYFLITQFSTMT